MSAAIDVADEGALRRITLDRPAKINALDSATMAALAAAIGAPAPPRTRLVVLAGAGEKGFCAGADIAELAGGEPALIAQANALQAIAAAFDRSPLPIVTLLHGRTLGAGGLLACLSTIVIAADTAVIGFPEIHFGLYPMIVHGALLERVSAPLAFQLCASGRMLSAREALDQGIVTEVLAADGFAAAAAARLDFYAARAEALMLGRQAMAMAPDASAAARIERLQPLLRQSYAQPFVREGIAALLRPRTAGARS
jgi:enoyl-CoA hydratase